MAWLRATVLAVAAALAEGREVLPPHAYLNRTVYPVLTDYGPAGEVRYPDLSIGLVSDVQYADQEEVKRRHFKLSKVKLEHMVAEFNGNWTHLDMVVHMGDLVDHSIDKYLPPLQPVLARLKAPLYQVLGNHDYLGSPESSFGDIYKKLGMPSRYYSLAAGKGKQYRVVVLDGNDRSLYSTVSGSKERKEAEAILGKLKQRRAKNANKFNGAVGDSQLAWLRTQLSEACTTGQRVVIFVHHPIRPKGEPTNLWNDLEMSAELATYHCVVAVMNGHSHKYMYDYHVTRHRHIHYVTWGGMVQSPFTSFGFADFYPDVLVVHGLIFGREIHMRLNISRSSDPSADVTSGATARPAVISAPVFAEARADEAVPTAAVVMMDDPTAAPKPSAVAGSHLEVDAPLVALGVVLLIVGARFVAR